MIREKSLLCCLLLFAGENSHAGATRSGPCEEPGKQVTAVKEYLGSHEALHTKLDDLARAVDRARAACQNYVGHKGNSDYIREMGQARNGAGSLAVEARKLMQAFGASRSKAMGLLESSSRCRASMEEEGERTRNRFSLISRNREEVERACRETAR